MEPRITRSSRIFTNDDDETDIENIETDISDLEDDGNIADKIELIGDKFEVFGSKKGTIDTDFNLTSDQYFLGQSRTIKASKQPPFSTILEGFDLYEADINKIIEKEQKLLCKEWNINSSKNNHLLKYYHLLKSDFNLLLYGYGSKRLILKQFAEQELQTKHHYVIIHGYMELIKLRDVILTMNKSIGNDSDSFISNEIELFNLMKTYFESEDLFVLIHSIDVLFTKNLKIRNFIQNLFTMVPNVRIMATVDHANSPLLWSMTETSTYRWLWFNETTFQPYLIERKFSSSQSSVFSTDSKSWKQSTNLLAIRQVYNSVNNNAQKIFNLILKMFLESRNRSSTFTFYSLYLTCREEFLVNSEVTLREHLAEFKYHNLIKMIKASDGAESIQVMMDKETVKRFINDSKENE